MRVAHAVGPPFGESADRRYAQLLYEVVEVGLTPGLGEGDRGLEH